MFSQHLPDRVEHKQITEYCYEIFTPVRLVPCRHAPVNLSKLNVAFPNSDQTPELYPGSLLSEWLWRDQKQLSQDICRWIHWLLRVASAHDPRTSCAVELGSTLQASDCTEAQRGDVQTLHVLHFIESFKFNLAILREHRFRFNQTLPIFSSIGGVSRVLGPLIWTLSMSSLPATGGANRMSDLRRAPCHADS